MGILDSIKEYVSSAQIATKASKPKYSGSLPKGTVKQGTRGEDALALQKFLNWIINAGLDEDSYCGKLTTKAIKKWQKKYKKKYGLAVDGVFGPNSRIVAKDIIRRYKYKPLNARAQKLVDKAVELAWPKGTPSKKYVYPSGSATAAFRATLNKVYPEHNNWAAAPSKGASCDVFVGTAVRAAGLAKSFPRGLQEQFEYDPKNFDRFDYKNVNALEKSRNGDIVMFDYGNGAHTVIRGNGNYYEANYTRYFGHTNTSLARLNERYPRVVILRPKE